MEKRSVGSIDNHDNASMKLRISCSVSSLEGIEKYDLWLTALKIPCNNVTSLVPLASCKNIKKLDMRRNEKLKSLRGIENLTLLEDLNISSCDIDSFVPLRNMKRLGRIIARNCPVCSFIGLQHCEELWLIECSHCEYLRSLKGLPYCEVELSAYVTPLYYIYFSDFSGHDNLSRYGDIGGTAKFGALLEKQLNSSSYISWLNHFSINKLYDYF